MTTSSFTAVMKIRDGNPSILVTLGMGRDSRVGGVKGALQARSKSMSSESATPSSVSDGSSLTARPSPL